MGDIPLIMNGPREGIIYQQMANIMADVPSIPKGQRNQQQGYQFRGIDDLYQTFHSLFAKHGVVILPEVLEADYVQQPHGRNQNLATDARLRIRYTFVATDGSSMSLTVQGESRDYADKATAQAMSSATKYGLLTAFLVPTEDTPDADRTSPEIQGEDPLIVAAKRTVLELAGGDRDSASMFWKEHERFDPEEILRLARDHFGDGAT